MMVAEFTLPTPEEREARRKEIEEEIRLAEEGASSKTKDEDIDLDEAATETTEEDAMLPGAPDLDALMDEQSDDD